MEDYVSDCSSGTTSTYQVLSGSSLEPFDLSLVESMRRGDLVLATVVVLGDQSHVDARGEDFETFDSSLVGWLDLVLVGWVDKVSARIPCFFKLVSWIRASERVMTANLPRKRGSRTVNSREEPSP